MAVIAHAIVPGVGCVSDCHGRRVFGLVSSDELPDHSAELSDYSDELSSHSDELSRTLR